MAKVIVRAGKIGFVFILPILILAIVLYAINYSATAQVESEEALSVPTDLFGEAKTFQQSDQIPEAEAVYRRIMAEQAGTATALDAAKERVFLYIDAKDGVAAEQCLQDLTEGFTSYAGYPKALLDIGDKYRQAGKKEQAGAMYQYMLETYPQDENAIWARMDLAMLRISGSSEEDANPDMDILAEGLCPRSSSCPCGLSGGGCLSGRRSSGAARALYDFVGTIQPASESALWSKMGKALLDIEINRQKEADELTAEILTDHGRNEQSANATCRIADAWRKKGKYAEAKAVYQRVVEERPRPNMPCGRRWGW